jgi:hypothetical protein
MVVPPGPPPITTTRAAVCARIGHGAPIVPAASDKAARGQHFVDAASLEVSRRPIRHEPALPLRFAAVRR